MFQNEALDDCNNGFLFFCFNWMSTKKQLLSFIWCYSTENILKSALQRFLPRDGSEEGTFMPGTKVSMNMQVHEKRLLNEFKQKQKDFFIHSQQQSTYTLQNDLQHNEKYKVFWSEGG